MIRAHIILLTLTRTQAARDKGARTHFDPDHHTEFLARTAFNTTMMCARHHNRLGTGTYVACSDLWPA